MSAEPRQVTRPALEPVQPHTRSICASSALSKQGSLRDGEELHPFPRGTHLGFLLLWSCRREAELSLRPCQSMLSNWPHLGCHRSQRVSRQPYEAFGTNYSLSLEKLSSTCPVVSTRELPKVAKVTLKLVRLDFPEKNIFKVVVLQQVS